LGDAPTRPAFSTPLRERWSWPGRYHLCTVNSSPADKLSGPQVDRLCLAKWPFLEATFRELREAEAELLRMPLRGRSRRCESPRRAGPIGSGVGGAGQSEGRAVCDGKEKARPLARRTGHERGRKAPHPRLQCTPRPGVGASARRPFLGKSAGHAAGRMGEQRSQREDPCRVRGGR
jgi:hypothetical protein